MSICFWNNWKDKTKTEFVIIEISFERRENVLCIKMCLLGLGIIICQSF